MHIFLYKKLQACIFYKKLYAYIFNHGELYVYTFLRFQIG